MGNATARIVELEAEVARLRDEVELWKSRYEAAEQAAQATIHHCDELLRERGYYES